MCIRDRCSRCEAAGANLYDEAGLIAKENVVATFGVLYNFAGELSENGDEIWALVAQDYTCLLYTSRCV